MFFFKKNKFIFFVLDQLEFLLQTAGPKLKIKSHIQVFKKVKKWKPLRKGCSKVSFFDIFSVLGPYTRAKSCFPEKIISVLRRNTATFSLFFLQKTHFFPNTETFWIVLSICEGELCFNFWKNSDFRTFLGNSENSSEQEPYPKRLISGGGGCFQLSIYSLISMVFLKK